MHNEEMTQEEVELAQVEAYIDRKYLATEEDFKRALGHNGNNRLMALLELEEEGFWYLDSGGVRESIIYWTENIDKMEKGHFENQYRNVGHAPSSYVPRRMWYETD